MKVKLFILVLFYASFGYAQKYKTDSLLHALTEAKTDTGKTRTLLHLAYTVGFQRPDTAILMGLQCLNSSYKHAWAEGIVMSQYTIGLFYEIKGDMATALSFEDSALDNSTKYKYGGKRSSIYNELGNITSEQNDYAAGLDYFFKALAIDSIYDPKMVPSLYNNIGLNYEDLADYVNAEGYFYKALRLFDKAGNTDGESTIYSNLGNVSYLKLDYQKGLKYNLLALKIDSLSNDPSKLIPDYQNTGLGFMYLKNYPLCILYTYRGLAVAEKAGIENSTSKAFGNIGITFYQAYEGDTSIHKGFSYTLNGNKLYIPFSLLLDSALQNEQKAVINANRENDRMSFVVSTRAIGDIYVLKKQYLLAIEKYKQVYAISDSLGFEEQAMEYAQVLGHTLAKAGNYKDALMYLDKVITLRDTIFSKAKTKQINELEELYQSEKKQKEIETLGQKNEIQNLQLKQNHFFIIGLVSLVLLVVIMGLLYLRQNRIQARNTKIELQQKLLRSQMNPHFIFNAMTSIQNFIYKEEPQKAANYLSSVFKLMRSILDGSKHEYITLEKEIASLNYYLVLQQLCFQNKFDFAVEVDPELEVETINIPPMIAQPFIENAVEHGIANKTDGKGLITIRLKLHGDLYTLEIEDNGVGRAKAAEFKLAKSEAHLSVATNITKERIALLNKNLKHKITMTITDLKNERGEGCGTRVAFSFPQNITG